jgi:hypothetical protein
VKLFSRGKITALVAFFVGFWSGLAAAYLLSGLNPRYSPVAEEMRVTSPDGQLDAVMVCGSYGGGEGGFEWYVFIVLKGHAVPAKYSRAIFHAGRLYGETLVWSAPRVVEIRYSTAVIEQFRNEWNLFEVEDVGPLLEHNHSVEIRLVPSSSSSIP